MYFSEFLLKYEIVCKQNIKNFRCDMKKNFKGRIKISTQKCCDIFHIKSKFIKVKFIRF